MMQKACETSEWIEVQCFPVLAARHQSHHHHRRHRWRRVYSLREYDSEMTVLQKKHASPLMTAMVWG